MYAVKDTKTGKEVPGTTTENVKELRRKLKELNSKEPGRFIETIV